MKFKALALAALAVASVGSANATIGNGNVTKDAELFLVVFDDNASYTKDLGVTLSQWDALSTSSQTWSLSGDSAYNSFNAQVANASKVQWAVVNGTTIGDIVTANDLSMISTVKVGQEAAAAGQSASGFVNGLSNLGTFVSAVNGTGTHNTTANGSSYNTKGTAGYFSPSLTNFNNFIDFSIANSVGATSTVTKLGTNDFDPDSAALQVVYTGTIKLNASSLDYTVPTAAVPEPGTYAMLLAGLGALAFVARRRSAR